MSVNFGTPNDNQFAPIYVEPWSVSRGKKINVYFRELLFTSHCLNLQQWIYTLQSVGNIQGLYFDFPWHFYALIGPRAPMYFPPASFPVLPVRPTFHRLISEVQISLCAFHLWAIYSHLIMYVIAFTNSITQPFFSCTFLFFLVLKFHLSLFAFADHCMLIFFYIYLEILHFNLI